MDVMNVEQARIAEEAGASAVMALGMSAMNSLICRENTSKHQERWRCRSNGEIASLSWWLRIE